MIKKVLVAVIALVTLISFGIGYSITSDWEWEVQSLIEND